MESVYVFPSGDEETVRVFLRRLYSAWAFDLKSSRAYYDITVRRARADRNIRLLPLEDSSVQDFPAESGTPFLIFTSEAAIGSLLEAAAADCGAGLGPFACPLQGEGFSIEQVVTFKR